LLTNTLRFTGALSVAAALLGGTAAVAQTSGTVAFLMPDQASTRYEERD
jgi:D-xylose transport system substrate-binding protein